MAAPAREDRRRQILAAATRVFARKGFHACRVGDIAKEAGVAYGLMYHYFSSKDELLETIFRDTWTQMVERIREVEDSKVPVREQVRQVSALVLRTWIRDPDLIRVLVREITRSPHLQDEVDEIGHAFAALERIIRRGQEQGEVRADLEPRVAAYVFYGALEEILTGWVMGGLQAKDEDVSRAERAVVAILCDGLVAD
jgi:TetR/AcrR family transcriptional regulator, fatty acid metabolism regulator protein